MKKTGLNTALSTAFIIALGFGVSACGGEKEGKSHEVLAKDRVDEAAELARKNAPEAEKMEFPETAPAPAPVTEADGTVDGAATAEAGTTATDMTDATDSDVAVADSAVMPANSADVPAADTAATPTADAEPATN